MAHRLFHGKSLESGVCLPLQTAPVNLDAAFPVAGSHAWQSGLLSWTARVWGRLTDLSVMMLGFTVTTSVFTPTSMVYFSEMGGRLHLQKTQAAWLHVLTHSRGSWRVGSAGVCGEGQIVLTRRGVPRQPAGWSLGSLRMEGQVQLLPSPTLSGTVIMDP